MSYRVVVEFKVDPNHPVWIEAADIVRIFEENELPESNFIEEALKEARKIVSAKIACVACRTSNDSDAKHCKKCGVLMSGSKKSTRVELKRLYWSGNHASDMLEAVAPFIHGRLEAFFVGEDGNIPGGALICNGVYTACGVEMRLVPKPA